jgi:hypothetical protein
MTANAERDDGTERQESNGRMYHAVCHDCEAEDLVNSEFVAHLAAENHADKTGHDVEVGEVEG